MRPERNGYLYVLDRTTGEVLSATPYAHITSTKGVDLQSGRLIYAEDKKPEIGKVVRDICPAAPGAKDWQPSAFSPQTGLLYLLHNNLCMDWEEVEVSYIAGTPCVGTHVKMYAGPGGHRGALTAWDPVAAKQVWSIKEKFPVWSGALATAGGVVFYGTMEGWFKARHAHTGEELWRFKAGSGIIGQPITSRVPDDKQYVAVLAGVWGLVWRHCSRWARSPRRDSGPGICQCHDRSAGPYDQGGHALCFCTPMKDALRRKPPGDMGEWLAGSVCCSW